MDLTPIHWLCDFTYECSVPSFSDSKASEKSKERKDENVKINSQNGQVQYAALQV
jgi:hypothetical protein